MEKKVLQAEELLEQIFYYMGQLVNEKDFSASMLLLTDLGRVLVNSERASFWYWDTRKKQYWTLAALDSQRIIVPEGTGIVGASIQNNETITINNPYEDPRFNPQVDKETGYVTKSILCMPVTNTAGKVIGAYQAINKLDDEGESAFDERDVRRMALAAMYCGKNLESQLLYQEAHMDQLTGLKNRRGFYEYYEDVIEPGLQEHIFSVVMCDIDHFKNVNDTYGHNAGDVVLVHISSMLQEAMQEKGAVVRWGGEEFIMLLPDQTLKQAAGFAELLRKKVEASICTFEDLSLKVTMSFGVNELSRDKSSDENIKEVDEKLYRAKTTGRNKVVA